MVVQVLRVRNPFKNAPPFVQGDLDLLAVSEPRPRLRFLGSELHGHTVVRRRLGSGSRRCDDTAIVASREGEPCPHLVSPPGDLSVLSFGHERECGLSRRFGSVAGARVVLDATDQERELTGQRENFAVLRERQTLLVKVADASATAAPRSVAVRSA